MKYLTHRFINSRPKSIDTIAGDDIDEFKFDWISPSIIDRAKDVLQKLKHKHLKGLYLFRKIHMYLYL